MGQRDIPGGGRARRPHPGASLRGRADRQRGTLDPRVTADLPIATPSPVYVGHAEAAYPWPWLVARWIDGEPVESLPVAERGRLVEDLAETLRAIHRPAPRQAPRNRLRGIPLTERLGAREQVLAAFGSDSPLLSVRDRAVTAPPYAGPRLWLHGDPHPLNLLQRKGSSPA